MPHSAQTVVGAVDEDNDRRDRERSAIAEARESLRQGRFLRGTDAEIWLDAWGRGEEPPLPDFDLTSDGL